MTASALHLEVGDGNVGLLTFDQPDSRANTLNQAVLAEFEEILAQLEARRDLHGLILRSGKPGMFVAGADLKELGSAEHNPEQARNLVQRGLRILERLEALPYPTVAAIEGSCMGGGLELALAFDHRVASTHPKTELGLPETKVGLIPGWGGTQRLPRIIGPAQAVEMIAAGESVSASKAAALGLVFDAVPSEWLLDEARRLLRLSQENGDWHKARLQKRQPVGLSEDQHAFLFAVAKAAVLARTKGQLPAPLVAVEVIERSCNLPLPDGLRIETEAFSQLVGSPVSRNLIRVFFMGQRLQKDPGVADAAVRPKEISRVGVLGAGIMGSGIAGAFIRRGIPCTLLDVDDAALAKGVASLHKLLMGRVEAGRMKPEEVLSALARLSTTLTLASMADRDLVIEAVTENEEVKVATFRRLQEYLGEDRIIASNTSTISITRMAKAVKNPSRFAGMHFFNPVDRMPLVEVIRGEQTSDETVATLVSLARRIGKSPIVVKDCPGFLVNRILFPYINEALVLLEEGASARAIDKAATDFGMPMGPITLNDVVGNDTALYAGRVVNSAFADRAASSRILEELVRAGRLGQKSGAGFYSYAKDPKRGEDDPEFEAILARCRKGHRQIAAEEITDRLFLPMLLEATRCLTEGIVREPADVEMGLILGIGFPAWRGGILHWAQSLGLEEILRRLKKYEHLGPRFQATEGLQMVPRLRFTR
jgi:3-hydroxyacyl-CoA dehydrogenase/enoyl-CoA hydratase/3-hydroxybutyryl-CoA epimerase/3-hydroxyacyl-CoA dehydrogenase/enoyl-CoA hydratase/3-hydroxybutyryl-CoA epimerase/enoyl-CoA isomerase